MRKTLLTLGILAVVAIPVITQADVEILGEIRGSLDFMRDGDNAPGEKASSIGLQSNNSYLGLRGDGELAENWSVVWQVEHDFDLNTDSSNENAYSDSESFIGIASPFGQIHLGELNTPYKSSTLQLDPFLHTRADYRSIIGTIDGVGGTPLFDNRPSDTFEYLSPDLAGFSARFAYVFGGAFSGNGDTLPLTNPQGRQNAYSGALAYSGDALYVTAAYEQLDDFGYDKGAGVISPSGGPDARAVKFGGSYTILDTTTLAVIWENVEVAGLTGNRDAYYFSAQHRIGAANVMFSYGRAEASQIGHDGANLYALGASYALSKDTNIYLQYDVLDNGHNGLYTLDQIPNSVSADGGLLTGKEVSAVSLGIDYKFSSK